MRGQLLQRQYKGRRRALSDKAAGDEVQKEDKESGGAAADRHVLMQGAYKPFIS